jgi:hypothetical protein
MHNPSTAQIEANRSNAQWSGLIPGRIVGDAGNRGQGKVRSSQNAVRHGLAGRVVVLPTEEMEVYKAFSKELVDSLNPETPMERQSVRTIADCQWRLNRARTFEDGMIALGHGQALSPAYGGEDYNPGQADSPEIHSALTAAKVFRDRSKDFVNLSLYEQRIQRAQKNAFDQLRQLQADRKSAHAEEMRLSAALVPAKAMTAGQATPVPPNTSQPNGFVYSNGEPGDQIPPARPSANTECPGRRAA